MDGRISDEEIKRMADGAVNGCEKVNGNCSRCKYNDKDEICWYMRLDWRTNCKIVKELAERRENDKNGGKGNGRQE